MFMFFTEKKININNLFIEHHLIKMMFNTVIENVFYSKIYKNNIYFLFLKFYFDINISK
jgi:hypothetical protein